MEFEDKAKAKEAWTELKSPEKRCNFLVMYMADKFPHCAKAGNRAISMQVTSAAAERNWSIWGQIFADARRTNLDVERATMQCAIMAHHRQQTKDKEPSELILADIISSDFVEADED